MVVALAVRAPADGDADGVLDHAVSRPPALAQTASLATHLSACFPEARLRATVRLRPERRCNNRADSAPRVLAQTASSAIRRNECCRAVARLQRQLGSSSSSLRAVRRSSSDSSVRMRWRRRQWALHSRSLTRPSAGLDSGVLDQTVHLLIPSGTALPKRQQPKYQAGAAVGAAATTDAALAEARLGRALSMWLQRMPQPRRRSSRPPRLAQSAVLTWSASPPEPPTTTARFHRLR